MSKINFPTELLEENLIVVFEDIIRSFIALHFFLRLLENYPAASKQTTKPEGHLTSYSLRDSKNPKFQYYDSISPYLITAYGTNSRYAMVMAFLSYPWAAKQFTKLQNFHYPQFKCYFLFHDN